MYWTLKYRRIKQKKTVKTVSYKQTYEKGKIKSKKRIATVTIQNIVSSI